MATTMATTRQLLFLLTCAVVGPALVGCGETDAELFAYKTSPPPTGGGTFRLDESADIVNGTIIGDCSVGCGPDSLGSDAVVAGDLDGDGFDDVLFGSFAYTPDLVTQPSRGGIYVVYGHATWAAQATLEPDAILQLGGIDGELDVAPAGDVDGDGYADFLVGSANIGLCRNELLEPPSTPLPDEDVLGRAHLVYGGPTRLSGAIPIASVSSTIVDETRCLGFGVTVASAGDLDGDGYGEFVVGSDPTRGQLPPEAGNGRAYLFYGGPTRLPMTSTVAAANATLRGRADAFGFASELASAGDTDGDGDSELLIADAYGNQAPEWYNGAAAAYLIPGGDRLAGDLDATTLPGHATFTGDGLDAGHIAPLGDIDEDGLDDVAFGGKQSDEPADGDVAGFLFYGRAGGFDPSMPVSAADVVLRTPGGAKPIAAAGDLDGDGHRDILVGDYHLDDQRGAAYLISGTGGRWTGDFALRDIAAIYRGSEGLPFDPFPEGYPDAPTPPRSFDRAGASVAGDGDIDGDGKSDVLVGAPGSTGIGRVFLLR
ncbi:MAG TPA: hypothetical protein VKB80_22780 [Kofleriaceae bacterium]|nr:hypothetical protein [Kofleriaceae bacterium]